MAKVEYEYQETTGGVDDGYRSPPAGPGWEFVEELDLGVKVCRWRRPAGTAQIDWPEVERLVLLAFIGRPLSPEQQKAVEEAYRVDPREYSRRSQAVREEERARLRSIG